jgi:outer membrane protein
LRIPIRKSLTALLVSLAAAPALAQEPPGLPLWEIGAVGYAASQQAYPGASARVNRGLALPFLIYRGEYLRTDRASVGIRAVKTPIWEVDIGVAASFGASSEEIEVRRGMPNLGTLVQFGPRLKWMIGEGPGQGRFRAEFPLRGVFDLDHGLAHKGMAFEPELIYERRGAGGWNYSTSIGAVWGDRQLADMFYGVAPVYVTAGRPAYVADSGLITWRLAASVSRDLSPDLRLYGFARADSVARAANESSPLVQQKTGTSIGLGLVYTWKRSERLAAD